MKDALLLFDIDGTLLTSGSCGKNALNRAFDKIFGIQNAWGNILPDGKTDKIIANEMASAHLGRPLTSIEWTHLYDLYTTFFAEESENFIHFQSLPGTIQLLEDLSRRSHIYLAVATGNIESVAWVKLRKAGLHSFFSCGGFGADHMNRTGILKDALDASHKHHRKKFFPRRVFVIGDTKHDVIAAHALELRSVGVDTGTNGGTDFVHHPPHHRLKNFLNIDAFLNVLNS